MRKEYETLEELQKDPHIQKVIEGHKQFGGTINIIYKDITFGTSKAMVEDAISHLMATVTNKIKFERIKKSVQETLEETYPKIVEGNVSDEQTHEFLQDVLLWFAIEVIEGRQSLMVN